METARVERSWWVKGLGSYSNEAILGTLRHYGVQLDEAAFRSLAGQKYPVRIAEEWHRLWKGTGPFARFPLSAAEELFRRLEKGRLLPSDFAGALVELMEALDQKLAGSSEAPVAARFERVEGLRTQITLRDGKPVDEFIAEVVFHLGELFRVLNGIAESLARGGLVDDAEKFATLEENLFPVRKGTARALVRAARGEKPQAIEELLAVAADAAREADERLMAVDALIHVEALEQAEGAALPLFEAAKERGDLHLALDLGERLEHFAKELGLTPARRALLEQVKELALKHEQEHPGHHH